MPGLPGVNPNQEPPRTGSSQPLEKKNVSQKMPGHKISFGQQLSNIVDRVFKFFEALFSPSSAPPTAPQRSDVLQKHTFTHLTHEQTPAVPRPRSETKAGITVRDEEIAFNPIRDAHAVRKTSQERREFQQEARAVLKEIFNNPTQEYFLFGQYIATKVGDKVVSMNDLLELADLNAEDNYDELDIDPEGYRFYEEKSSELLQSVRRAKENDPEFSDLQEKYKGHNPRQLLADLYVYRADPFVVENGRVLVALKDLGGERVDMLKLMEDSGLTTDQLRATPGVQALARFRVKNEI